MEPTWVPLSEFNYQLRMQNLTVIQHHLLALDWKTLMRSILALIGSFSFFGAGTGASKTSKNVRLQHPDQFINMTDLDVNVMVDGCNRC